MDNIIRILDVFFLASRLKININKSNLYGVGVSSAEVANMAEGMCCSSSSLPFSYLGLPIGSNMGSITNWTTLIDRFKARLSGWKANMLSSGGGLDVGSLKAFNMSLLLKWSWRLLKYPSAFWVKVVKSIHGDEGDSWLGDVPLCSCFNRLFHLDRDKNCLVKDRFATGAWSWNWFRPINGGRALADLNSLLMELGSITLSNKVDSVSSSLSSDGSYLHCSIRLPHRLNLSLRGLDIDSIMCPLCNNHVESNAHVFFSCDIARDVWSLVRGWCDSKFPSLSSCDDWDVWNNVTFHSQVMRKCDIFDNIRLFSFSWLKSRGKMSIRWTD
ncbi:RNA-directed DNA polymerase, eukaryota, reverse transcriptase zinc-binding domain protein [Tanacetum coccineum]